MSGAQHLALAMLGGLCALTLLGFPVAFTLGGIALAFAALGTGLGHFDPAYLGFIPNRIYGVMTNGVLIAIPLFVFMGVMLERSRVAGELLDTMGELFGRLRGGLGVSVSVVGALLAASTGIVGATVVTMGLLALPTMLRRGYDPALACGTVAAAGTLGQIIPPSIVLVLLGDQISSAHQEAQRQLGNFAPEPVSVGDLFAGALIPGVALVALYIAYQLVHAWLRPHAAPALAPAPRREPVAARLLRALVAPLTLVVAVLGSILAGIATPTEAAAVGAVGAILLAGLRLTPGRAWPVHAAVIGLLGVLALGAAVDLRVGREQPGLLDRAGIVLAALLLAGVAWGLYATLTRAHRAGLLHEVTRATARFSAMVFAIVIGAGLFSIVFRGLGGDALIHALLGDLPGGAAGAMAAVMIVVFLMGFVLDVVEITFVVVPVVAPVLLQMDLDPVWLGVMFALNLQTAFLTPPLGYALFYLRGVAPPGVSTGQIYRGVVPFVLLQLAMLGALAAFPALATWLPGVVFAGRA